MEDITVCKIVNLTVNDFKTKFPRGFEYYVEGTELKDPNNTVLDSDILEAYGEAKMDFDCTLWNDEEEIKRMFLLLSAFYLLQDFNMQGLQSSTALLESKKKVGDVSVSNVIAGALQNSPIFSYYLTNPYGYKYAVLTYRRLMLKRRRMFTGKPNLA